LQVGKTLKYRSQQVKVVGYLDLENELTLTYKPQYRIVVESREGVKYVHQVNREKNANR
jgi:hypothetical protein